MLALVSILFTALVPCSTGGKPQPNSSKLTVELPPIPVYPSDGKIPPELKNRFVFLDEKTYELVVSVPADPEKPNSVPAGMTIERMALGIGVCPSLDVSVHKDPIGGFDYEYQVENRPEARQSLSSWTLPTPFASPVGPLSTPNGWDANAWEPKKAAEANERATMIANWGKSQQERIQQGMLKRRIDWRASRSDFMIAPGRSLALFRLRTAAWPGIVTTYFQGPSKVWSREEWPQEVSDQLATFSFAENNSLSMSTIGPKFDPAIDKPSIAKDFLHSIETLIKSGELSSTSRFINEAISHLAPFVQNASGPSKPTIWISKPSTILEQQILLGIQMSLETE